MSVEKIEIEMFFGRCRCCLSYGYLKNMWKEHDFKGEPEIYGEMLVQCFALTWDQSEEAMEQDQICEQCIGRLREANEFKKVVLDSQEELLRQIDSDNAENIKEETLEGDYILEYKDPESETDTVYDTEYAEADAIKDEEYEEIEYLEEEDGGDVLESDSSQEPRQRRPATRRKQPRQTDTDEEEAPKRKWPKKLPKSERQKTYKQYSEGDLRKCLEEVRNHVLTASEAALKYSIPKKTICAKIKVDPKDVPVDNTTASNNIRDVRETATSDNAETKQNIDEKKEIQSVKDPTKSDDQLFMYKHKANLKVILENSNATLIGWYGRDGFICNFCDFQAERPLELKQHNVDKHPNLGDEAIKTKYVTDLIIKLDITNLKCRLCSKPHDTLEDFIVHLSKIHSKHSYTDVKNYIVPFKFGFEDYRCFVCEKKFKYFKLLSEHMTEHYNNYNCTICARGFVNKQAMQTHFYRHKPGKFKCSYCSKEFDTRPKKTDHERTAHVVPKKTRKCAYCSERFASWESVIDHEFKSHGIERPLHTCDVCGKVCNTPSSLTSHKNRIHLFVKPHKCSICDKAFCTKMELSSHIVTHTKTKNYTCDICKKAFGTLRSLNQHKHTHGDEKKFLCDYCDRRFLIKITFKKHMRDIHGEIV